MTTGHVFGLTVANGASRTWLDLQLAAPAFDTRQPPGRHRQKEIAPSPSQRNYSYSHGRRLSS